MRVLLQRKLLECRAVSSLLAHVSNEVSLGEYLGLPITLFGERHRAAGTVVSGNGQKDCVEKWVQHCDNMSR